MVLIYEYRGQVTIIGASREKERERDEKKEKKKENKRERLYRDSPPRVASELSSYR